ncbi:helix-turn-helix domain-containing protein [Actinoallomurus acaciae]|uniref:Helix-turn-helix domain-containing protein n=1 Tax=Actinoallomurus acaciae TaxID=502577 RepID=A0ABV5YGZ3_9ACTN
MHDVSPERDDLLKPREVAELFGVRTTTIARWAREGKLTALRTPGGHRRYSRADIRRLVADESRPHENEQQIAEDAARLYDQGWSIRKVAEKFDYSYGAMRRLLRKHVTLRNRGGTYAHIYDEDRT